MGFGAGLRAMWGAKRGCGGRGFRPCAEARRLQGSDREPPELRKRSEPALIVGVRAERRNEGVGTSRGDRRCQAITASSREWCQAAMIFAVQIKSFPAFVAEPTPTCYADDERREPQALRIPCESHLQRKNWP